MRELLRWVIDGGCLLLSIVAGCWIAAFLCAPFITRIKFEFDDERDQ